jgi:hypothetical protein
MEYIELKIKKMGFTKIELSNDDYIYSYFNNKFEKKILFIIPPGLNLFKK